MLTWVNAIELTTGAVCVKNINFVLQNVLSLSRLPGRRKVRATQSILLPNGKAPAAGDSKCHRKYTAAM